MPSDILSELPPKVVAAFEGRTFLNYRELRDALEMTDWTLRHHIEAGDIEWRQKGRGARKITRMFSLPDVARFWIKVRKGNAH